MIEQCDGHVNTGLSDYMFIQLLGMVHLGTLFMICCHPLDVRCSVVTVVETWIRSDYVFVSSVRYGFPST